MFEWLSSLDASDKIAFGAAVVAAAALATAILAWRASLRQARAAERSAIADEEALTLAREAASVSDTAARESTDAAQKAAETAEAALLESRRSADAAKRSADSQEKSLALAEAQAEAAKVYPLPWVVTPRSDKPGSLYTLHNIGTEQLHKVVVSAPVELSMRQQGPWTLEPGEEHTFRISWNLDAGDPTLAWIRPNSERHSTTVPITPFSGSAPQMTVH